MDSDFKVGRLHHIGIAVKDIRRAAQEYEWLLGLRLVSEIVVEEAHKVRVGFVEAANGMLLELVEPLNSESPVTRMLLKGTTLYHICYEVPNMEHALRHVRSCGALVVSAPQPSNAFSGRRTTFVFLPDKSLVEFLEA